MGSEHLNDGVKLEAAWHNALSESLTYFRALLASSDSTAWKPLAILPLTASTTASDSGKSRSKDGSLGRISASDVQVHRRSGKGGEVFRAVVECDAGEDVDPESFLGTLTTPEIRPHWDRMVEGANTLELLDANTRVTKTKYRLGWPSSPRDAVTISKTFRDTSTLIDISTSLPRSKHEPAYLRPAPPYVRAHCTLLAWCIQMPSAEGGSDIPSDKVRITCFWQWNPKGTWAVGGGVPQHMPSMLVGLVDHIREGSDCVPRLSGYGKGVAMGSVAFDPARVTLAVNYSIINDPDIETEGAESVRAASTLQGAEALQMLRERRRLERKVEFSLSSTQSWDVRIHVRSHFQEDSDVASWTSSAERSSSASDRSPQIVLRFSHPPLEPEEDLARVSVSVERTSSSGSSSSLRINGVPVTIQDLAPRSLQSMPPHLLRSTPSASGISLRTMSTANNSYSRPSSLKSDRTWTSSRRERSPVSEKNLAGLIRRNYIYFTSLLQEPEAKWKPVSDSRGVAVHQLDSIDRTLVVYRAEATFVDVGVWDLFATIFSPGARVAWDKSHEDAVLLDDVNELSDLWLFKSRAAWPIAARDSVMLRTTYKSPSSVHIFGFSTDDTELFPNIPPSTDPAIIRTQIDLQGWSIEALSPNTTQVTLLEQSDPRGWSNKSSIPQVMINAVAGVGDFAIKAGGPPTATRFGSARALSSKYDRERESYRLEYEAAPQRNTASSSTATSFPLPVALVSQSPSNAEGGDGAATPMPVPRSSSTPLGPFSVIECEIRCDPDKWSNNIALVVDPPPSNVSALRRHRLSNGGGGLWLTIEHDMAALGEDKVSITVRKAGPQASKEKIYVTVNGGKLKVDVEDIPEADVKLLKKQKRTAPTRAPLDQPAALGTVRKRAVAGNGNGSAPSTPAIGLDIDPFKTITPSTTIGRFGFPFSKLYSMAAESTKAAIVPMTASPKAPAGTRPVAAAFDNLAKLRRMHAERATETTDPIGWAQVSDRDGLIVDRKVVPYISDSFPVFRAGKIIEGFMAEEVSSVISSETHRKEWDERLVSIAPLQSYGNGITTTLSTSRCTFPFRDRAFMTANMVARTPENIPTSPSMNATASSSMATIFHTSTSSFDAASVSLDLVKANPAQCPFGSVIMEGWVLETIDPYGHEQYAIPSTRCVYVVAVDYGGSIPVSVNNMLNTSLPRNLLGVEATLRKGGVIPSLRRPATQVQMPAQAEEHISADGVFTLGDVDDTRTLLHDAIKPDGSANFLVKIHPSDHPSTPSLVPRLSTSATNQSSLSPQEATTPRQSLKHVDSKLSVNSIASRTSTSTVIDLAGELRRAAAERDFVVAEIVLDSSRYPHGYDIALTCALHDSLARKSDTTDADYLPLALASKDGIEASFKVNIIALAPTVLQSAMLDPTTASDRHLVRITIPTSLYDTPIADPLTGKSAPVTRPDWLISIMDQGALVKCSLTPKTAGGAGGVTYTHDGNDLVVEDERHAMSTSRGVPRVDSRVRLPRLQRVHQDEVQSILPEPIAVAFPLWPAAARPSMEADEEGPKMADEPKGSDRDTASHSGDRPTPLPTEDTGRTGSVSAPPTRYSFWEYSRRITGFGSGSVPNTPGAPHPPTLAPVINDTAHTPPTLIIPPEDVLPVVATETDVVHPHTLMGPVVSLPALILIIIFSMLVGSLLRSLLGDADFVVFLPQGTSIPSGQGQSWKDLRRLLEIKGWGLGWDLVIAAVRRP